MLMWLCGFDIVFESFILFPVLRAQISTFEIILFGIYIHVIINNNIKHIKDTVGGDIYLFQS